MNRNQIIYLLLGVLIGVLGYGVFLKYFNPFWQGGWKDDYGMHMMSDGRMMKNSEMSDRMGMGYMGNMSMQDMSDMMLGKVGKDIEKAFLEGMIPHHQGAVEMAKILLKDQTISAELRKFAEGIIAAQEGEIVQMKTWLQKY